MIKENHSIEVIRYTIPQSEHGNFETAYTEAGKFLQQSKYCLGYEMLHGDDEPHHYVIIIYWTSKEEHLQGFRKSAEFMPFFNLVKPFFNDIEEMKHYETTDNKWSRL